MGTASNKSKASKAASKKRATPKLSKQFKGGSNTHTDGRPQSGKSRK